MKPGAGLICTAKVSLCVLFLALGFSFSYLPRKQNNTGRVVLNIEHVVGQQQLKLDAASYKNSSGQAFTVTKFKYYMGQLVLKQANGAEFRSDDYFLVNEEEEASKQIILEHVPTGHYTSLEFIIGVDSLHNCSGAQSGALDPVNGMFWAWNSGYIFLKLEGFSPSSNSPGHLFEYHIGGYRQPHNCIRKVRLDISNPSGTGSPELFLRADVMKLLENSSSVDFSRLSSVTDFRNADLIADNYKEMFSITEQPHED